ncbi:MAG TPA: hypothetical protein VGY94_11375 [Acidobacteriaceae bacterium]|jgi:hypothetical protein|nr:hypothetical protein [Acidobacteriaceae bacterium]
MFRLLTLGLLSLLLCPLSRLHAQASYTQLQPTDSGYGPLDQSTPSIPPDQIIQKFAAKESEFRRAMDQYTYTRSVKIETISDDGRTDGVYQQVTDISYDGKGAKLEHVTFAPANSLERIIMTPADMSDIEHRLPFVLTTEDLPLYNLKYVGRQKVDDVDTYVFDVAPKRIEKGQRYLQGRIWVDQHDLQIVVVSAKNVPDDLRPGHEDLSLPFTTYREQVDGQYWFPVYSKADGILHFSGGKGYMSDDIHTRSIVKYSNYKKFGSSIKITFEGQDITSNSQQPATGKAPAGQPPNQPQGQAPAPPAPAPQR